MEDLGERSVLLGEDDEKLKKVPGNYEIAKKDLACRFNYQKHSVLTLSKALYRGDITEPELL